ncbi:unnamed protein product [Prorocentrum cordatum]|uniref:PAS domain-containing protein n=1 Tax=Prorocentrum cordatum TaxID=2364126 RepID=A0ABN9WY94_9DINO|nr:unnamed protein product [Polarella glacialis]
MLGRLAWQLWTEGASRSCFHDYYARLLTFSTVVRTVILGKDGTQQSVHKRKQSIRLAMSRRSYQLFCVAVVGIVYPMFLFSADDRPHIVPRRLHYAFSGVVVVSVNVCPSLLTPSQLHLWYCLLLLSHAISLSPLLQFAESISPLKSHVLCDCLMYCMIDFSLPANLFWTTLCYLSAASTAFAGKSNGMPCHDPKTTNDLFLDWIRVVVSLVILHVVFSMVVSTLLEGQACRSELRAAKSILAGVCDAVVELDAKLMLVWPSGKLAALLMHSEPRSLAGMSISSFLATKADRETFAKQVTSSTAYDDFCTAFHVKLRDTCGISVSVEVFCVRCSSGDKKKSYLVGF